MPAIRVASPFDGFGGSLPEGYFLIPLDYKGNPRIALLYFTSVTSGSADFEFSHRVQVPDGSESFNAPLYGFSQFVPVSGTSPAYAMKKSEVSIDGSTVVAGQFLAWKMPYDSGGLAESNITKVDLYFEYDNEAALS